VAVALAAAVVAAAAGGRPAVGTAVAPRSAIASVAAALPPSVVPVGVADAVDVALPSPTGRSFKRWWRRNIKSIKKDLKKAGTIISRPFRKAGREIRRTYDNAAKAVAKVVREAGREVRRAAEDAANAVRKAGRDVRKFVKKRVKEADAVIDFFEYLFDDGDEEAEDAEEAAEEAATKLQEAKDEDDAKEKAADEAAAARSQKRSEEAAADSFNSTTTGRDMFQPVIEDAIEESNNTAIDLGRRVEDWSKPLSRSQRKFLTRDRDEALEVLGHAQNVAKRYINVVAKAKNSTGGIQRSAIKIPRSKLLATYALVAQKLLELMVETELTLANVMRELEKKVDLAKKLLA